MNRKRYWLLHKVSRSRYAPVPVEEVGEHEWSGADLTTADEERAALRQALIDERGERPRPSRNLLNPPIQGWDLATRVHFP